MVKVAIASFLKDEFSDIVAWLSWHSALGVDSFIIYDDGSVDGTWEILQILKDVFDLHLFKVPNDISDDFNRRQEYAFKSAISLCSGEFDWLGLLDSDEYLLLEHDKNIKDFLVRFSNAYAIAFSWRIHGSSGRVLRPKLPAPEVFSAHSAQEFRDNELIKSFVKPEHVGRRWYNPHWFDIPVGRYFDTNNIVIKHPGATQPVNWSGGLVMHFICRSAEHYVERIRKRIYADLQDSMGYWDYFNRNEFIDNISPEIIVDCKCIISKCNEIIIKNICSPEKYRSKHDHIDKDFKIENIHVMRLETECEKFLFYDIKAGQIVLLRYDECANRQILPVLLKIYKSTRNIVSFFIPSDDIYYIPICGDDRIFRNMIYRIEQVSEGLWSFRSPLSGLYIGKETHDSSSILLTKSDQRIKFRMHILNNFPSNEHSYDINFNNISKQIQKESFEVIINNSKKVSPYQIMRCFYSMDPELRSDFRKKLRPYIFSFS